MGAYHISGRPVYQHWDSPWGSHERPIGALPTHGSLGLALYGSLEIQWERHAHGRNPNLRESYGRPMGSPWEIHGRPGRVSWASTMVPWDSRSSTSQHCCVEDPYSRPMGLLPWVPLGSSDGIFMVPWDFHGTPVDTPWVPYLPWVSHGIVVTL